MALKIKKEYAGEYIGFNNSSLPLGMRNDLGVLFRIATEGNDQRILNMFETNEKKPALKEVIEEQGQRFLSEIEEKIKEEDVKESKPKKK